MMSKIEPGFILRAQAGTDVPGAALSNAADTLAIRTN
jgi:hypothetical protein